MKYFKDKNKFLKYVKNKVTVSLIYGAPCSGKTTFVESILGNDDIMIDLDKIVTCISKFNCVNDAIGSKAGDFSLAVRNALYALICNASRGSEAKFKHCYIIACAPTIGYRQWIESKTMCDSALLIDCDIDTCIERSKKKADGYDKIVNDWFSKYEEEDQ